MELKIRLKGIYQDYMQDVMDAINEMLYEYPILEKMIKIVHLRVMKEEFRNCPATSRELWGYKLKYEIKLNPEAFAKPDIYFLFSITSGAYYYSVKSIIYHEIGHCLQLFMPFKKQGLSLKSFNYFNAQKYYKIPRNKIESEYKNYFKSFYILFNWDEHDILTYLGSYAASSPMELLPECFNLYYSLRNIPKRNEVDEERYQFSKAVVEDYKENYL